MSLHSSNPLVAAGVFGLGFNAGQVLSLFLIGTGVIGLAVVVVALASPGASGVRRFRLADAAVLAARRLDAVVFVTVLVFVAALVFHGVGVALLSAAGALVSVCARAWLVRRKDDPASRRNGRGALHYKGRKLTLRLNFGAEQSALKPEQPASGTAVGGE